NQPLDDLPQAAGVAGARGHGRLTTPPARPPALGGYLRPTVSNWIMPPGFGQQRPSGVMTMTRKVFRLRAWAGKVALAAIIAVAGGTGAFAGPVADKAAEAESLLSTGDAAGALDAFDA